MTRSRSLSSLLLAAGLLSGCCPGGTCIKDPPCRPCENPCCLTATQKVAFKANTHAIHGGPVAYTFEDRPYVLFTEKGRQEFEKDPTAYKEKGAIRLIKSGKTVFVDVNPGDDVDIPSLAATAVPYVAPDGRSK